MKINDVVQLGKQIRIRREKLGYTQSYISEYTGLSVSFISEVENGKETAQISKVMQLIQILGMDIDIKER